MTAATFRRMHDRWLLLPNAWDAMSARLAEAAGAPAVATSSAALAWSLGFSDGQRLPFDELERAVKALRRVTTVPLTVDCEQGYADEPGAVARHMRRLVDAGAVGVNLEDAGGPPERLVSKIAEIRRFLTRDELFINARTCVVLRGAVTPQTTVAAVVERGRAYAAAGADGFFVPKLTDAEHLRAVAAGCPLPLNVLLMPGLPRAAELQSLGVRRLSLGPRWAELAYSAAASAVGDFLAGQAPERLVSPPLGFGHFEALSRR